MTDLSLERPVLVTGATGFLGHHLCQRLLSVGAEVHALRRDVASSDASDDGGVVWHTADLTDPGSVRDALIRSAPSVVFHLAARGTTFGDADLEKCFEVNVRGSLNLWQAITNRECRLIVAGSCGEYGQLRGAVSEDAACQPTGPYSATKHAAVCLLGALARESGREVVILRPYGPYGPGDRSNRIVPHVIRRLIAGKDVEVTAGEQLRDYTFIEDQMDAFVLAATKPLAATGRIYNIGSGQCISLKELVAAIARTVSEDALARVHFGARPYRETEVWEMCANVDRARHELGYEPRTSLSEGLRRTVDWHRTAEEQSG